MVGVGLGGVGAEGGVKKRGEIGGQSKTREEEEEEEASYGSK